MDIYKMVVLKETNFFLKASLSILILKRKK